MTKIGKGVRYLIMDTLEIISRYYSPGSLAYNTLVEHSRMVVSKCLEITENIRYQSPDISFLKEAAMLHDIGIFLVKAPDIGCYGDMEYICHGYLGRDLLEKEGFPKHALVCERHVGVGLSISDIMDRDLPLPARDMLPVTLEEKIICYADKFYSKKPEVLCSQKTLEEVREDIRKYGEDMLQRFDEMTLLFSKPR
jgi:uncharacterized protein